MTTTKALTAIIVSGGVGGATVERANASPSMPRFHVGANGDLTFEKVTVRNGASDGCGGAIYNRNRLTLLDSWVTLNTALEFGGGIYNDTGSTATLTYTVKE